MEHRTKGNPMTRFTRIAVLGLTACIFTLPACKDADEARCEKVAEKAMAMAGEMAKALTKMLPADKVKEMEKEMAENMAKQRPEMITSCQEALKENPDMIPVMDCIIAADGMAAMAKCDPEGKTKSFMKQ